MKQQLKQHERSNFLIRSCMIIYHLLHFSMDLFSNNLLKRNLNGFQLAIGQKSFVFLTEHSSFWSPRLLVSGFQHITPIKHFLLRSSYDEQSAHYSTSVDGLHSIHKHNHLISEMYNEMENVSSIRQNAHQSRRIISKDETKDLQPLRGEMKEPLLINREWSIKSVCFHSLATLLETAPCASKHWPLY